MIFYFILLYLNNLLIFNIQHQFYIHFIYSYLFQSYFFISGQKGTDEELKKADEKDNKYYINYNNNVFPLMGEFGLEKSYFSNNIN